MLSTLSHESGIRRITNSAKVTDHHAILLTVQLEKQDLSTLPESEQKIVRLAAMRLLSAIGEKHIHDETSVILIYEGLEFNANGKTVVRKGWKAIASVALKPHTVHQSGGSEGGGVAI